MDQYYKIKAKYPDALLLFRVGDFYETFGEDAVRAADILGIVLTQRKNGSASSVELAGIPYHALDSYLPKLVRAGERVAICDQLEDPQKGKKIVKRGVTELVTPGVAYNDKILDHRSNNFLAAVHFTDNKAGVSFLDVSTGEFLVAQGSHDYIEKLLQGFEPNEVLFQKGRDQDFHDHFGSRFHTYRLDDWVYTEDFAQDLLLGHFKVKSLKGFGIERLDLGVIAAGAVLHYLNTTQHDQVGHISGISRIEQEQYVWMDQFTVRNLEILNSPHPDATTLLDVLDKTVSPMGARMLKRWLVLPLKDEQAIAERAGIVEYLTQEEELCDGIVAQLDQMGDLERLISKVSVNRISPREVIQLQKALAALEPVKEMCEASEHKDLQKLGEQLDRCETIRDRIEKEVQPDPPAVVSKGNVIRDGVNEELDDLRHISRSGKDILLEMQKRESEKTGIPSLKVAFNNVFGYYLEVKNTHKDKVPAEWVRKQTLVNAERYITEELKEHESKILGAEEKILDLETRLFNELVRSLGDHILPVQNNATLIARLDCLASMARIAKANHYVRPRIDDSKTLNIKQGRHPVIEQELPVEEEYVANDVYLDNNEQQVMVITGPNMSGKSALLRQTALITLMAQIGSFVPAETARVGLVDKIFTRVGASDNISSGESTFMVEMNETASILNNLSDRSLVLLDEIGRGTSTYDGMSIAWAIAEYIHENPRAKAKTLFATHYHELNDMERTFERIRNFNVAVKEVDNKVIFLRNLEPGGSEHSFGIHVAEMAGMPEPVVKRAQAILQELEANGTERESLSSPTNKTEELGKQEEVQLSFFQLDDPVLAQIRDEILNTDVNTLTPVEALMKLNEIKKLAGGNKP